MILSEQIAAMIEEMLSKGGGTLDLKRNELAGSLGCVPSQINYVLTSRFTPAHGYRVESRRGGGGYVRITKLTFDKRSLLLHFYSAIGDAISEREARDFLRALSESGALRTEEASLMFAACTENTLSILAPADRAGVRAQILRGMLLSLASQ